METYTPLRKFVEQFASVAQENQARTTSPEHLLWMIDRAEEFQTYDPGKAGRWVGWVCATLALVHEVSDADIRQLIRDCLYPAIDDDKRLP